jgi:Cu/Ag efflux protein CusF
MKLFSMMMLGVLGASGYALEWQLAPVFAASTFISSTIMEVSSDGRKVTIRTAQGESWSLPVSDPELLKGVKKGDQVSLELDTKDEVSKIVKTEGQGEGNAAPRTKKEQARGDEY